MISGHLIGGLGNQMFVIATTLSCALDNNTIAVFSLNKHLPAWQAKHALTYKDNIYRNLYINDNFVHTSEVSEPFFGFFQIPFQKGMLLNGYFQSGKFFNHNKLYIQNIFEPSEKFLEKIKGLKFLEKNTCSIHIRRGDYLKLSHIHPFPGLEYYEKAMHLINAEEYIIFSDDISWCQNQDIFKDCIFISDFEDYEQLWLMSLCKNNIIANSSFSWWGSYLNKNNDKKVVAPNIWFGSGTNYSAKDIYTKEMIII